MGRAARRACGALTAADAPTEPREIVDRLRAGRAGRARRRARCRCTSSSTELERASSASYGWGRLDMVENRRVGIKSRETYECPAALALILAHADLESITLERDLAPREGAARAALRRAHLRRPVVLAAQARRSTRSSTSTPAVRHRRGAAAARAGPLLRRPAGAADTASTTTASPPTTPPTRSATRTPPGFVRLWGLGVETWAARQGHGTRACRLGR